MALLLASQRAVVSGLPEAGVTVAVALVLVASLAAAVVAGEVEDIGVVEARLEPQPPVSAAAASSSTSAARDTRDIRFSPCVDDDRHADGAYQVMISGSDGGVNDVETNDKLETLVSGGLTLLQSA
jgi:hypothetical protein